MKKRRLIMALVFLAFAGLAVSLACGEAPKATPVVVTPTPVPEEEVATPTAVPPAPTPTPVPAAPTPAPLGTSPDNPAPVGSSLIAADGAKITINGIVARGAEAAALVQDWNMFNPEPGEGKEYVIISGKVAYEGGKEETLSITSFDFRAVVKGVIVDAPFMLVGDGELLEGEMFAGGSIDGHLVFEVDEGATGIVLIYTVLFEESYFFATE